MSAMQLFLMLVALAAMIATAAVLVRGLVNMAGGANEIVEGDGPSERALKSQKLMRQRILFQAAAIFVIAILLFASAAGS